MRRAPRSRIPFAAAVVLSITVSIVAAGWAAGRSASSPRHHTRPRALAFNPDDGLLYVALSTADGIAVVAPTSPPRLLSTVAACRFPQAVAALPGGGVLVACRFDSGLLRIVPSGGGFVVRTLAPGLLAGTRGLAVAADGRFAYVSSPPLGGVAVVSLQTGAVLQELATGLSPRAIRLIQVNGEPRVAVSNFIEHAVTLHRVGGDGLLSPAVQTIRTAAPVLDLAATSDTRASLWLLTHEDRSVSRAHGPVEGLDSGVIRLAEVAGTVADPGPGARPFVNLGDRPQPVIELEAAAVSGGGTVAMTGGGSDNLLLARAGDPDLRDAIAVAVGANPSAVAALADGRFVTADRLSDTLTFVTADGRVEATLPVGEPERTSLPDLGELLFHGRALVPHNVATGPLSLYTCAACHPDGDRDGRLHPAKQNRFFSTTLTCRGLANTAPFLRLGNQATLKVFADNIVSTHAQGAERDPAHFADYPVTLRVRRGPGSEDGWRARTLSPAEVRAALAAYMATIPPEPSPFVAAGARALDAEARRGLALFRDRCAGCHRLVGDSARGDRVPEGQLEARLLAGRVALTAAGRMDVGTPVLGEGGNNPPSLRGVWDAAPYFSDGSARTLEEALRRTDPDADAVHAAANAARPPAFSPGQQAALLAFLRAL
ncbi:MAG TPA: c-type cytochrome [Polyangia bacterium]|nr:c-type cytochrome [Polyangia bacterium]